jgi:hypothetical protein
VAKARVTREGAPTAEVLTASDPVQCTGPCYCTLTKHRTRRIAARPVSYIAYHSSILRITVSGRVALTFLDGSKMLRYVLANPRPPMKTLTTRLQ